MPDAIAQFFENLGRVGYHPLWRRLVGTIRVELVDEDRIDKWIVAIDKGDVSVTRNDTRGACTVRADRSLFAKLARGERNAMAAVLRGDILVGGDVEMLFALQRAFPGPMNQHRPAAIDRSDRWEP
jgi:hypothetical protein